MGEVSTIGLDIAKAVFQVHGVDGSGTVVIRKRVSRVKMLEFFSDLPPCLVGIEACPSAHHWGRQLQLLGHTVKLMPPSYVEGLSQAQQERCERCGSGLRSGHATVDAVRSDQDQTTADGLDVAPDPAIAGTSAHDAQQMRCAGAPWPNSAWCRPRAATGRGELLRIIADVPMTTGFPGCPRHSRYPGAAVLLAIGAGDRIHRQEHSGLASLVARASRRLAEIPRASGPIVATAMVAEIGDWKAAFASGRNLAAWIGLVPKQHTTGGKDRLGSITKQGNRYLRWLLVVGAMAVIRYAQKHADQEPSRGSHTIDGAPTDQGGRGGCSPKSQRMAWAIMVHGDRYKEPKLLMAA